MADERFHAVAYDVEHDGFLGVDAHAVQEVAAEGVIPEYFIGRDQGRTRSGPCGHLRNHVIPLETFTMFRDVNSHEIKGFSQFVERRCAIPEKPAAQRVRVDAKVGSGSRYIAVELAFDVIFQNVEDFFCVHGIIVWKQLTYVNLTKRDFCLAFSLTIVNNLDL